MSKAVYDGHDFDERIQELVPKLRLIVQSVLEDAEPQIVCLRDEAMSILRAANLLQTRHVRADVVGCHPSNRYGDGVVPAHVHGLMSRILAAGWSDAELDKAYAVDAAPLSHPLQKANASMNHAMALDSQGLLPPYEMGATGSRSSVRRAATQISCCVASSSPHLRASRYLGRREAFLAAAARETTAVRSCGRPRNRMGSDPTAS